MTITAKISSSELTAQVTDRFADTFFETRLIDATGITYTPGITNESSFLSNEFPVGTAGYQRFVINWTASDVLAYSDDGVSLQQKAATFAHDGGATSIDFSHVALVWSTGNVIALDSATSGPVSGVDGTYANVPVAAVSGSGVGLSVDLTITNGGVSATDYTFSVASAGYGFAASNSLQITNATLQAIGATTEVSGDVNFTVSSVSSFGNAGSILSVAQTASPVVVTGGNEVAFYFNLKQFGFNS